VNAPAKVASKPTKESAPLRENPVEVPAAIAEAAGALRYFRGFGMAAPTGDSGSRGWPPGEARALLALQRVAGNHAVGTLIKRENALAGHHTPVAAGDRIATTARSLHREAMEGKTSDESGGGPMESVAGRGPSTSTSLAPQRRPGNQSRRVAINIGAAIATDEVALAAIPSEIRPRADVQRWPTTIPPPGQRPTATAQGGITPGDRRIIEDETRAEIVLAFTAFTDACQANLTSMKAAAKAEAELRALFIDIAVGFLAPGLATYIVGKMAARAAEKLSETVSKTTVRQLISDSDLIKASFQGAGKTVGQAIKARSTTLFGEAAEDALLDGLKVEFQSNAVVLAGQVGGMTDAQLVSVWLAYDPQSANVITYKGAIKEILAEYHDVQDIGTHEIFSDDTADTEQRLVFILTVGWAIAAREKESLIYDAGPWSFRRLVPSYFLEAAKKRDAKADLGPPPVLWKGQVSGLPDDVRTHKAQAP
jgi:hypothetical protein